MTDLYTGIALGIGAFYILIQFGIAEVVKYKKYVDLGIFVGLMAMVFNVGTNFIVAMTTWAGLTVSMLLLATSVFYKPK